MGIRGNATEFIQVLLLPALDFRQNGRWDVCTKRIRQWLHPLLIHRLFLARLQNRSKNKVK